MILTKPKSVNAGPSSGTGKAKHTQKRWYVAISFECTTRKSLPSVCLRWELILFVPVQQQIHHWSDRRKMVDTVLLPMMVFVHVNPKERMEVLSHFLRSAVIW